MKFKLIAVGKRMPDWVKTGFQDYQARLPKNFQLSLIEVNTEKRTKNSDLISLIDKEAESISAQLAPGEIIVTLDERGNLWSTLQLAQQVQQWHDDHQTVALIIGGPDGLAESLKQKAHHQWSLSPLIFPHPLVRIIVAEQIYRAVSLLHNHPYHRE